MNFRLIRLYQPGKSYNPQFLNIIIVLIKKLFFFICLLYASGFYKCRISIKLIYRKADYKILYNKYTLMKRVKIFETIQRRDQTKCKNFHLTLKSFSTVFELEPRVRSGYPFYLRRVNFFFVVCLFVCVGVCGCVGCFG